MCIAPAPERELYLCTSPVVHKPAQTAVPDATHVGCIVYADQFSAKQGTSCWFVCLFVLAVLVAGVMCRSAPAIERLRRFA